MKNYYCFVISLIVFSCNISDRKIHVGFSQAYGSDEWRLRMNNSLLIHSQLNDIDLTIYDGGSDISKQIEHIERFISDSVDLIIVSPIEAKPITKVIQKALDLKIPVIAVDRKTANETYTAYIGGDNFKIGIHAGNIINSNNKSNKQLNILEISGRKGSTPAYERTKGFKEVVDNNNNLKIIKTFYEERTDHQNLITSLKKIFESKIRVDFIFAHNDRMAKTAWKLSKEYNLENEIKFIGVDGLIGEGRGIDLVQKGILLSTILYKSGSKKIIDNVVKILNGEKIIKENILETVVIDSYNAEIMRDQLEEILNQELRIKTQNQLLVDKDRQSNNDKIFLFIIIFLLILSLIHSAYSVYNIMLVRDSRLAFEEVNKETIQQKNQIEKVSNKLKHTIEGQSRFFMNISHEFKTPLTLILSSIDSLKEKMGPKERSEVFLIQNNSRRLIRLINELVDYRKIKDKKGSIKVCKTNVNYFLRNILDNFRLEAKKRNINIIFKASNLESTAYIDHDLMEKVIFNLLSNAFKFTPDNGKISIEIAESKLEENKFIEVKIIDSGIGIPPGEIKNVFKPFFKASNNKNASTGVGLYLSSEFIKLNKGLISIFPRPHGTEFRIKLPIDKSMFNSNNIIKQSEAFLQNTISDFNVNLLEDEVDFITDKTTYEESILIIEDNRDLSQFLKSKFEKIYNVHLSNGHKAIEKAFELIPDITVCDVNLPDKNGYEICQILKNDLRTSHIPTIILTGRSGKNNIIKGLDSGADLYLTKPFSFSVLSQSIESLLKNREKLRYYYTNNINNFDKESAFENPEQKFFIKLNDLIKNNIENAAFGVQDLASELGISRVQLYRKVKSLLKVNISDYIINYRLQKAKALIERTSLNISEIAYSTGFSSPNYFSTAFKHKYGLSPASNRSAYKSEFMKK